MPLPAPPATHSCQQISLNFLQFLQFTNNDWLVQNCVPRITTKITCQISARWNKVIRSRIKQIEHKKEHIFKWWCQPFNWNHWISVAQKLLLLTSLKHNKNEFHGNPSLSEIQSCRPRICGWSKLSSVFPFG